MDFYGLLCFLVSVLSSRIPVQETARDLDVVIDSRLTLPDHVASVCRSGYYQLRQLRPAVRCSSDDATKTLVQAFIASRLDYCNALFYGITDELNRRLQSVQNAAAARLVTGTRRSGHISPVLCSASCTSFRCGSASCSRSRRLSTSPCPAMLLATWSTTVNSSPTCVSDKCVLLTLERSQSTGHTAGGGRTFAAAGTVWNGLPPDQIKRQPGLSHGQFRRSMKTFLFGQ